MIKNQKLPSHVQITHDVSTFSHTPLGVIVKLTTAN